MIDKETIKALIKIATLNYLEAQTAFKEFDNYEDMRESNRWRMNVEWLEGFLEEA